MKQILLFLLFLPLVSRAQLGYVKDYWTDGYLSCGNIKSDDSTVNNDSTVLFFGGNNHDAGNLFVIKMLKDHSLIMIKTMEDTFPGKRYNKVQCKTINGYKLLIVRDSTNRIRDLWWHRKDENSKEPCILNAKEGYGLDGKYINKKTKKEVVFYPDGKRASGLTNAINYYVKEKYDEPIDVITFTNGKSFYYELRDSGLSIYNVKGSGDDWEKTTKIMDLQKVYWFNMPTYPSIKGKFPFASARLFTLSAPHYFSKEELKIMRNEIFARHGLIFKSEEMKTYFSKQAWYKPQFENVSDKLTDLEKFNVELIQTAEENSQ